MTKGEGRAGPPLKKDDIIFEWPLKSELDALFRFQIGSLLKKIVSTASLCSYIYHNISPGNIIMKKTCMDEFNIVNMIRKMLTTKSEPDTLFRFHISSLFNELLFHTASLCLYIYHNISPGNIITKKTCMDKFKIVNMMRKIVYYKE